MTAVELRNPPVPPIPGSPPGPEPDPEPPMTRIMQWLESHPPAVGVGTVVVGGVLIIVTAELRLRSSWERRHFESAHNVGF